MCDSPSQGLSLKRRTPMLMNEQVDDRGTGHTERLAERDLGCSCGEWTRVADGVRTDAGKLGHTLLLQRQNKFCLWFSRDMEPHGGRLV